MYKINIKIKTGRIKIISFNNSEMRQKKSVASFAFKTYFIFGVFFAMAFAAENKNNDSIYLSESEINYCENDFTQFGSFGFATIANGYVCQILVCEWLYNVAFGLRKFSQRNSHLR